MKEGLGRTEKDLLKQVGFEVSLKKGQGRQEVNVRKDSIPEIEDNWWKDMEKGSGVESMKSIDSGQ